MILGLKEAGEYVLQDKTGGVYDYVRKCKQIIRKWPAGSE